MKPKKPGFLSTVLDSLISTVEASVREALEQTTEGDHPEAAETSQKPSAMTSVIKNLVEALQKNGNIEVHYEVKSVKPHLDVASEQPKLASNVPDVIDAELSKTDQDDSIKHVPKVPGDESKNDTTKFKLNGTICTEYTGNESIVVVPEGITIIGSSAFKNRRNIEEVVLPETLRSICASAFKGCTNLAKIIIPWNVSEIGDEAFAGCRSLKSIELPESIQSLGKYVFSECISLEFAALPHSLRIIPEGLFSGCGALERIRWPDTVEDIQKHAFLDCYDSDVWTYYELDEGIMRRMRADPNELDPEHVFYLPQTPFVQSCIYNILDKIHAETIHLPELTAGRISIFRQALKFCRILTGDDTYAVGQMAELCNHVIFTMTLEDMQNEKALESLLFMTAEAIGGSGQTYKLAEKTMYDIYKLRYKNSKNYQEAIKKSMGKALNLFGAELTPMRYHPMVWHHTASFCQEWDYLNFVFRIEGLLRGLEFEVTRIHPDCSEDDTLEQWLSAWSQAIEPFDLVIIDFKAPQKVDKVPNHIFSITSMAHAEIIRDFLESCHCSSQMECWNSGSIVQSGLHFV